MRVAAESGTPADWSSQLLSHIQPEEGSSRNNKNNSTKRADLSRPQTSAKLLGKVIINVVSEHVVCNLQKLYAQMITDLKVVQNTLLKLFCMSY